MFVKCDYCGFFIDEELSQCPHCGAPNAHMRRNDEQAPKTIAQLQAWYEEHHLPPYEKTRFFIGINYDKPKAYGIYEQDGIFCVYKNKADGTRAIRYEGKDEAYAVNELYEKLKLEIAYQKGLNKEARKEGRYANPPFFRKRTPKEKQELFAAIWVISSLILPIILMVLAHVFLGWYKSGSYVAGVIAYFPCVALLCLLREIAQGITKIGDVKKLTSGCIIILCITIVWGSWFRHDGYYRIDEKPYVCIHNDWYEYDSGWSPIDTPDYDGSLSDYYESYDFESGQGYTDFTTSSYYDDYGSAWTDSDSDWSSSDSWDSDSTSSGWDSDW